VRSIRWKFKARYGGGRLRVWRYGRGCQIHALVRAVRAIEGSDVIRHDIEGDSYSVYEIDGIYVYGKDVRW
jgi:hypothetical protein